MKNISYFLFYNNYLRIETGIFIYFSKNYNFAIRTAAPAIHLLIRCEYDTIERVIRPITWKISPIAPSGQICAMPVRTFPLLPGIIISHRRDRINVTASDTTGNLLYGGAPF